MFCLVQEPSSPSHPEGGSSPGGQGLEGVPMEETSCDTTVQRANAALEEAVEWGMAEPDEIEVRINIVNIIN